MNKQVRETITEGVNELNAILNAKETIGSSSVPYRAIIGRLAKYNLSDVELTEANDELERQIIEAGFWKNSRTVYDAKDTIKELLLGFTEKVLIGDKKLVQKDKYNANRLLVWNDVNKKYECLTFNIGKPNSVVQEQERASMIENKNVSKKGLKEIIK